MLSSEQTLIINHFGVRPSIVMSKEICLRTRFLVDTLQNSGHNTYVIGISGGVDSTVAGVLVRNAVTILRCYQYDATMIGVRLPYGMQIDKEDARNALSIIQPDRTLEINIKSCTDDLASSVDNTLFEGTSKMLSDFNLGNIKARQRMVVQYAVASETNGLVVGTDHAAEAVMGFFTKFGDGAADIMPLAGLNKRQIMKIGKALNIPDELVNKVPTADLETNKPGLPDEVAFGLTYSQIDDFLEGKDVGIEAHNKIVDRYFATIHKRRLPVTPFIKY
jgi:NAD+ synthase